MPAEEYKENHTWLTPEDLAEAKRLQELGFAPPPAFTAGSPVVEKLTEYQQVRQRQIMEAMYTIETGLKNIHATLTVGVLDGSLPLDFRQAIRSRCMQMAILMEGEN